jgi:hypothetical protein
MIAPAQSPAAKPHVHEVARHPDDGWSLAEPVSLSGPSLRALESLVWALLPPAPAPRPAGIERRVQLQVRCMLQYMPTPLRLGFIAMMHVLAWSPVWRMRRPKRLGALSQSEASAVLAGIAQSRFMLLRLMMLAPKAIVLSAYFDQDEVHARLDYEPKAFIRERTLRRQELLAEGSLEHANETTGKRRVQLEVLS